MNRYHNEKIIEHLASHYVLGSMSVLVKTKTEKLIKQIPELERAIYRWQQDLIALQDNSPCVSAPKAAWKTIEKTTNPSASIKTHLRWWQTSFAMSLCCAFMMTYLFIKQPSLPAFENVSYVALLHADGTTQPQWVVTSYEGQNGNNNRLTISWNHKAREARFFNGLQDVWSMDHSGKFELLGTINSTEFDMTLDQQQWQLIQDSRELLIVNKGDDPKDGYLYKGLCVSLAYS